MDSALNLNKMTRDVVESVTSVLRNLKVKNYKYLSSQLIELKQREDELDTKLKTGLSDPRRTVFEKVLIEKIYS